MKRQKWKKNGSKRNPIVPIDSSPTSAATVLQTFHQKTSDEKLHTEETSNNKAATKIQAAYRGYYVRKKLSELTIIGKNNRTKQGISSAKPDDLNMAATCIQATYRGYKTRKELREKHPTRSNNDLVRHRAATRIQAKYRGYKTRKYMNLNPTSFSKTSSNKRM